MLSTLTLGMAARMMAPLIESSESSCLTVDSVSVGLAKSGPDVPETPSLDLGGEARRPGRRASASRCPGQH